MTSYRNVALLGKGTIGTAITEALAKNGFTVTVLSRDPSSIKDLPSGVKAAKVDYSSHQSLVAAFKGQDVVLSTLGFGGIAGQPAMIDAAIEAGVKRFIPSDWASISTDPDVRSLSFYQLWVQVQDYLTKKAEEGKIEYTIFQVGAFLEYIINYPLVIDFGNKSTELYDDGNHKFSATSVAGVGKAVVGALSNPEASKNRTLFTHEIVLSQAQIVDLVKKHDAKAAEWSITKLDSQKELVESQQALDENPTGYEQAVRVLKATVFGGKYRAAFAKVDNGLVGLSLLPEGQFEEMVVSKLAEA